MRRPLRPIALSSALAMALAACVRSPEPAAPPPAGPVPPPVVAAPAPPPAASDWRDWPFTPGTWTYGRDSRGTRAMFGIANADALLVLRCDMGERRLYLSRAGASIAPLTVRTTSTMRTIAVQPTGGALPYVAAALSPDDRLLDAMAFSRGRVVIEQAGIAPLVVPAWAEIGRVIEDCRG